MKEEAETLRWGIELRIAPVADAVAWADAVIAAQAHPDPAIIDLSLAGRHRPADVSALLRRVPGQADPRRVARRVMGMMLRALDADPLRGAEIAGKLYLLWSRSALSEEEFGNDPLALDDAFDLAGSGAWGVAEDAVAELRAYLEAHAL